MGRMPEASPQFAYLPGERFDSALHAFAGALDEPAVRGDAVTVTDRRVVKLSASGDERALTMFPLARLSAVEVIDVSRPAQRLGLGLLFIGVGVALGLVSWSMLGVAFVSVLVGGVPALAGVYALAGWAFPDGEGSLRLYVQGHVVTQPLRSAAARRDAHVLALRLAELMVAAAAPHPAALLPEEDAPPPEEEGALAPSSSARVHPRRRPASAWRARHGLPRPRAAAPAPAPAPRRRRA